MGLERGGPEPLYKQLAAILRARIEEGELRPRAKMPSLTEIMAKYEVADGTARRAIEELQKAGLVTSTPGLGTFVAG